MSKTPYKLMISRTDGLGDLCLTLPVFGWLKENFPEVRTQLLVAPYAESLARKSRFVDEVLLLKDRSVEGAESVLKSAAPDHVIHVFPRKEIALGARKAGIPKRTGILGRPYHWTTCTDWIWQTRKKSGLHETELNLALVARAMGVKPPQREEIQKRAPEWVGYSTSASPRSTPGLLRVLLHPFSFGSGREWPLSHFAETSKALQEAGCEVFVGGSREEGAKLSPEWRERFGQKVRWVFGETDLAGYIELIESMDAVIASGTGPLHVAGISGRKTLGLFPPKESIDSGRWAPIGRCVQVFQVDPSAPQTGEVASGSQKCKRPCSNTECLCMAQISPETVISSVLS